MNQCPNCLGKGCTRCLKPAESVKLPASMVDVIGQIAADRNPPPGHVRLPTGEDIRHPFTADGVHAVYGLEYWYLSPCGLVTEMYLLPCKAEHEKYESWTCHADELYSTREAAEAARGKKEGRYE